MAPSSFSRLYILLLLLLYIPVLTSVSMVPLVTCITYHSSMVPGDRLVAGATRVDGAVVVVDRARIQFYVMRDGHQECHYVE